MREPRMKYGIFEPNRPEQTFGEGPIYSIGEPPAIQDYSPSPDTVAATVLALRKELDLSLLGFSKLLNTDPRTLQRWENGQTTPSGTAQAVIAALTEALNTSPLERKATIEFIKNANAVGGISYILVKLLRSHLETAK